MPFAPFIELVQLKSVFPSKNKIQLDLTKNMKVFSLCALSVQASEITYRTARQAPEDRGINEFIEVFDFYNNGEFGKYSNHVQNYGKL